MFVHVFKNSESMKPRFFSRNFCCFILKQGRIYYWGKNVAKTVNFHKKRHSAAPFKENKTFFAKKIRGFVDLEFVKICHKKQVN